MDNQLTKRLILPALILLTAACGIFGPDPVGLDISIAEGGLAFIGDGKRWVATFTVIIEELGGKDRRLDFVRVSMLADTALHARVVLPSGRLPAFSRVPLQCSITVTRNDLTGMLVEVAGVYERSGKPFECEKEYSF